MMCRNIRAHKALPNNEGYEPICIHPDQRIPPAKNEHPYVRVQVENRYATDCCRGFPVNEPSLDAFDFLIANFLNTGKVVEKNNVTSQFREPDFYLLTRDLIREYLDDIFSWNKVTLRKLETEIEPFVNDAGLRVDRQRTWSASSD